jgi:hypothetical protein
LKKIAVILFAVLAVLAIAGCASPAPATPTPRPSDTTPGALPTQEPPATPTPAPGWLDGYKSYDRGVQQPLVSGVIARLEKIYYKDDWTLPTPPLKVQGGQASHGAIYELQLTNPTSSGETVAAGTSIRSIFTYTDRTSHQLRFISSTDTFYDPVTKSTSGQVDLAPGEAKRVYMIAYMKNDTVYEQAAGTITMPGLDAHPV